MTTISLGYGPRDAPRFTTISLVRKTVVTTRTESPRLADGIDCDHVGHGIDQPLGRRRRRRAQDDGEPGAIENIDRFVEPRPIEAPGLRLDTTPGEFADPHLRDAHGDHPRRIVGPPLSRPVLGVVADSETARFFGKRHSISSAMSQAVAGCRSGKRRPRVASASPDSSTPSRQSVASTR